MFQVNQNGIGRSQEAKTFQTLEWKKGDKIQASIVYVESPDLFWCQDVAFLNNILILSEELSRLHLTQEMKPLANIQTGSVCAAKFEEEGWYRGIIKALTNNTATVYFVDYGNTETVGLDSICNLKEEFRRDLPALAIKCCLSSSRGGKWSDGDVEQFENLVMDKEFEVKVVGRQGSTYEVTLFDVEENQDVGNQFLQMASSEGTRPKITNPPKVAMSNPIPKPSSSNIELPMGGTTSVFLSHIESPGNFWVQRSECTEMLDTLSDDLQAYYSQQRSMGMSHAGAFVIARFSEDGMWYRAMVLKEMEDAAIVLFIDYGNTETISKEELRQVGSSFGDIDRLAFHCSLAGVKPLRQDHSWSVDAKEILEKITENGCQCEVLRKNNDMHIVKLSVEGKSIAKELVSSAVVADVDAVQSKSNQPNFSPCLSLSSNQSEMVFVSHIESPHSVWVQLSKNSGQLDSLMEKLDSHYSEDGGIAVSKPVVGQACVAQYSVDNAWYRATLIKIQSNGYEVQFIDYGNTEVVIPNFVCVAEPRFLDLPPQAIECSLSISGNQQHLKDALADLILEKELMMKVLSITKSQVTVELLEGSQSITDLLKQQVMSGVSGGGLVTLIPAKKIPMYAMVKAFVSVVLTPSKFYIQLAGIDEELDSLMSRITSVYAKGDIPTITKPTVGMDCVALYQEDQQWYRGNITLVQGAQCNVLFVDYGNEEPVASNFIKELSSQVADVPIMAYECSLNGVDCDCWTESAIQLFESLVIDKELECTFVGSNSVSLKCNEEDIADKLVSAGYGKKISSLSAALPPVRPTSGGWRDETSPKSGRGFPAKIDNTFNKPGFDMNSPKKAFGESGGFSNRRDGDNQGFGGGRKREFSGASDKENSGFRRRDGGGGDQSKSRGFGEGASSGGETPDSFIYGDPPTEQESAILVHIDDDGIFYLQLLSMEKDILFLSKRLAGSYKNKGPRLKEEPAKGTVCCCKFADDGNMYRSVIDDVKGSDFLVRYVDYGNTALCTKFDLKFLFPDLLQYPVQAYPCKLKGLSWSLDKGALFGKATLDKDLKVTFVSTSKPYMVNISTPDGDLMDIMNGKVKVSSPPQKTSLSSDGGLNKSSGFGNKSTKPPGFGGGSNKPGFGGGSNRSHGFGNASNKSSSFGETKSSPAGFKTSPKQDGFGGSSPKQLGSGVKKSLDFESPSIPKQVFKHQNAPVGPQSAYISHVSEDGFFYLQLEKDTDLLDKLTGKLATLTGNMQHPNPSLGASCAAKFSEDSAMYRAEILKQEGDKCHVFFVDFGNGDLVNKSDIQPLTSGLLESSPLSYKCLFTECEPLQEDAQNKLKEFLLEHPIAVTFETQKSPFHISAITSDNQSLQDIVFPPNKFRSPHVPDETVPAGVSHIEEDGRFFLQLYKDYRSISELENSLESAYSSDNVETLTPVENEMGCCVRSEKHGGKWSRAKIEKVGDSEVSVFYVDYGHCSSMSVENVKVLKPKFMSKSPYALECRLKGVESWTDDLRSKFTEMTEEKILNATFHSRTLPFRVSLARSIELDLLGLKGPICDSPKSENNPGDKSSGSATGK